MPKQTKASLRDVDNFLKTDCSKNQMSERFKYFEVPPRLD